MEFLWPDEECTGRKGGSFKFADLPRQKQVVIARVAEAFADHWEAQAEQTLPF